MAKKRKAKADMTGELVARPPLDARGKTLGIPARSSRDALARRPFASVLDLAESRDETQASAIVDLAEALRRSEVQRSGLVDIVLKLDPGEAALLRQQISRLDAELVAAHQGRDQGIAQLQGAQAQLHEVQQALLLTQQALEQHQALLQAVMQSRRWRMFRWLDRLRGSAHSGPAQ